MATNSIYTEYTGERMIPEYSDPITFWEHVYRYKFAMKFVKGLRVLDIACGEGYGTISLLRGGAKQVIGVDISQETCQRASEKYGVDARQGSAENIPLENESLDIIVSFETIEHIHEPELFLSECNRLLVKGGKLLISTPNKDAFQRGDNPFHIHEMNVSEFTNLVRKHFSIIGNYGQVLYKGQQSSSLPNPFNFLTINKILKRLTRTRKHLYKFGWEKITQKDRLDIVKILISQEFPLMYLINPYAVRRINENDFRKYIFNIIVASK